MKHNKLQIDELNFVQSEMNYKNKSLKGSYVLGILLGFLGVHRAYLEKLKSGVLRAVLSLSTILIGLIILSTTIDGGLVLSEGINSFLGLLFIVNLGVSVIWYVVDLFLIPSWVEEINLRNEKAAIEKAIQSRYVEEHILKKEIVEEVIDKVMVKVKRTIDEELDSRELYKKKENDSSNFTRLPSPELDATDLPGDTLGVTGSSLNKEELEKSISDNVKSQLSRANSKELEIISKDSGMFKSLEKAIIKKATEMLDNELKNREIKHHSEDMSMYMRLSDSVDDSSLYSYLDLNILSSKINSYPSTKYIGKQKYLGLLKKAILLLETKLVKNPTLVINYEKLEKDISSRLMIKEIPIEPKFSTQIDFERVPRITEEIPKIPTVNYDTEIGVLEGSEIRFQKVKDFAPIKIQPASLVDYKVKEMKGANVEFEAVNDFAPVIVQPDPLVDFKVNKLSSENVEFEVVNDFAPMPVEKVERVEKVKPVEEKVLEEIREKQYIPNSNINIEDIVKKVVREVEQAKTRETAVEEEHDRYADLDFDNLAALQPAKKIKPRNFDGGTSGNTLNNRRVPKNEFIDIIEGKKKTKQTGGLPTFEEETVSRKTNWDQVSLKPLYGEEKDPLEDIDPSKLSEAEIKNLEEKHNVKVVNGVIIDKEKYEERKRRAKARALARGNLNNNKKPSKNNTTNSKEVKKKSFFDRFKK